MYSHISTEIFLPQVMNEVVIDRGPSPYITNLEVFCNGRMITTVQADGKIVMTVGYIYHSL